MANLVELELDQDKVVVEVLVELVVMVQVM